MDHFPLCDLITFREFTGRYKNSAGGTNVMFSLGYTVQGGRKMLVTVMAYDDIDGTIAAKLREEIQKA